MTLKKQVSALGKLELGSPGPGKGLISIRVCVRRNSWSSAGSRSCRRSQI
jgi:hypothetical protein